MNAAPYPDEDPGPGTRPPPYSAAVDQIEQSLLGVVLRGPGEVNGAPWSAVSDLNVSPADFGTSTHVEIAAAMQRLNDANEPVNYGSVTLALEMENRLGDIGGEAYLGRLATGAGAPDQLPWYCATVRSMATRRRGKDAFDRGDIGAIQAALEALTAGASKAKVPKTFSAAALGAMTFTDPRWAVPDFLPEGLAILAGKPKQGKSWLCLALGVAVASGGYALGKIRVHQGEVLYLALEDRERRLKSRLTILMEDSAFPERLTFATTWPRGDAGVAAIRAWLNDHRDARLVVIDTLARFRDPTKGKGNAYEIDYEAMAPIQSMAIEMGVCILVVHHQRKMDADDPMDTISGTLGITGACDAAMVLARVRGAADAVLHITGRDIEDAQHVLRWEAFSCSWTIMADADAATAFLSKERREVLALLATGPKFPKEIAEALKKDGSAVRKLLQRMFNDKLLEADGSLYRLPVVSHGGGYRESSHGSHTGHESHTSHGSHNNHESDSGIVTPCDWGCHSKSHSTIQQPQGFQGTVTPVTPVTPPGVFPVTANPAETF